LEFLGKRTPDHGLALQTTRYLLFEPSKGIEPLQPTSSPHRHVAVPHRAFEHAASSSLYARLFLQTISDAGRDGLSPLTGT
ncbi:hypothetical protein, partial [Burkholderia pseudomallei]